MFNKELEYASFPWPRYKMASVLIIGHQSMISGIVCCYLNDK